MLEKGSKIKYTGGDHQVLVNGEIYEVFKVLDGGIQVYMKTGFCGLKEGLYEEVS